MKDRIKKQPAWLIYTLIFSIIMLAYIGTFMMTGKSLIWSGDGLLQHFPILVQFRQMMISFLKNPFQGFTNYSFNIGLGADQLTSFSYYVVGDFFNYLIILFPKNLIPLGYGLLVILRVYVAGLAFLLYANLFGFKKHSLIFASLSYTFAAYTVYAGMHHPFFILPLIFFPLICYGIEKIIRNKSWIPLMLAVAITFFSNFYFTYIIGLGSIIYVVIRYFSIRKNKSFMLKSSLLKMIGSVISGTILSFVVFLPTMLFAAQSTRTTPKFASGYLLYPLSYYLSIPSKILGAGYQATSFWLIIGISGLAFLAILYTFSHFKKYLYLNIGLLVTFVGILIPAFASIFNAFSTPSNRWFVLALLPIGLASGVLSDHLTNLSKRDLGIMGIGSLILLIIIWASQGFIFTLPPHEFIPLLLLLVLVGILFASKLFSWNPQTTLITTLFILVINLVSTGISFYSPNASNFSQAMLTKGVANEYSKDFYDGANNFVTQQIGNYRTTLGYKYHTPEFKTNPNYSNANTNLPMNLGTHDISSYLTLENGYVGGLEKELMNNQLSLTDPVEQNDYRTSLDNLMGVKYSFVRKNNVNYSAPFGFKLIKKNGKPLFFRSNNKATRGSQNDGTYLLKNNNALPLAYTQNQTVSNPQFNKLNPNDKEQAMITGANVVKPVRNIKETVYRSTAKKLDYTVSIGRQKLMDSPAKVSRHVKNSLAVKNNFPASHPTSKKQSDNLLKQNQRRERSAKRNNKNGLRIMTNDVFGETIPYKLNINKPSETKNSELYLKLDGIKDTDNSALGMTAIQSKLNELYNIPNSPLDVVDNLRAFATKPFTGSYVFTAKTTGMNNGFVQTGRGDLSNYRPINSELINLGYSTQKRNAVKLYFKGTKSLAFKKATLIAVPFNNSYEKQIKNLQNNGLTDLKVSKNKIAGISNNPKKSVLTTSVPYSSGWKLKIDGSPAKTQVVNRGFVGGILPAGKHKIELNYSTPGLIPGTIASLIGLIILMIASIHWFYHRKRK